jgi:hypothetical protein
MSFSPDMYVEYIFELWSNKKVVRIKRCLLIWVLLSRVIKRLFLFNDIIVKKRELTILYKL